MRKAHKVGLDQADFDTVQDRANRLRNLAVDQDQLLRIVDDWESRQLIASKRFLSTFSLSLALVHVLGVKYSEIDLLLVGNLDNSQALILSVFLAVLLSISLVAYVLNLWGDLSARQARIDSIKEELDEGVKHVDKLHELIDRKKFPRVFVQSKQAGGRIEFLSLAGDQYQLIEIYRNRVIAVDRLRFMLNYAESCSLSLVGGFALGGILWYWLVNGGVIPF